MNINMLDVIKKYAVVIIGAFIFSLGINLFIVPVALYNGGVVGIAQIIRTIINSVVQLPANMDISGIINFLLNIPLLILAYVSISKKFFCKTLISVILQTIFFTLIKIPDTPIITDTLAACLIGGLLTGLGTGITLRAGGSGGGLDILGVFFAKKVPGFSVGKLGLIVNAFIYSYCAIAFSLPTAIYSIIYSTVYSMTVDKTHYQNINATAMIFTKEKDLEATIINELNRGVTYWNGKGGYTNEDSLVLVTVISKYEIPQLKKIIHDIDPHAFIVFNDGLSVDGNFEKRL